MHFFFILTVYFLCLQCLITVLDACKYGYMYSIHTYMCVYVRTHTHIHTHTHMHARIGQILNSNLCKIQLPLDI